MPSEESVVGQSKQPQAVIFDMDGTLVATTEADFLAWQRIFQDQGVHLSFEDYFPLLGKKSHDVVYDVLQIRGERTQEVMHQKMRYFEEIVDKQGIDILPHAGQLLDVLNQAKLRLGLATSSRQMKMHLVMERSGLGRHFDVFVTGEMVVRGKPEPDIFLLTAEKLGVDPACCVVVEDAVHGITAARAAGMKCVAIVSTHKKEELQDADLVINSFAELDLNVLSGLFE